MVRVPLQITAAPDSFRQVSALLGRIPSAVGYQPTLATDLASLQATLGSQDRAIVGPPASSLV